MSKKRIALAVAGLLSITLIALCCTSCSSGVQIAHASTMSVYCNTSDSKLAQKANRQPLRMAPETPVGGYRK